jgi:hypothetical protein
MIARDSTSGTDLVVSSPRPAPRRAGGRCTTRWGCAMASDSQYPDDWESRRMAILHRDNRECQRCGDSRPQQELHVHHKEPVDDGGTHELENLELRCADCHADEHDAKPCAFCFLVGRFQLIEAKRHSSFGNVNVCTKHLKRLKRRVSAWDVDEVCVVCRAEASGRYHLTEGPNSRGVGGGNLCGSCRLDILNAQKGDDASRRQLQQRFERGAVSDD